MIDTDQQTGQPNRWVRSDTLLAFGAIAGAFLLLFVLPGQHPYAGASYEASEGEVVERARAFIYEADELMDWRPARVPGGSLLQDMQHRLGRRAAVDTLKRRGNALPAFLWRVQARPDEGVPFEDRYGVRLDDQLRLWELSRPDQSVPIADRVALGQVYGDREMESVTQAVSDTLLAERFSFDPEADWGRVAEAQQPLGSETAVDPAAMSSEAALALARYHLRQMGHQPNTFRADSMWLVGREEAQARARTRFGSTATVAGYRPELDVEVTPAGMLWSAEARLVPQAGPAAEAIDPGAVSFQGGMGVGDDDISGMITLVAYLLLLLVMVVVFFRKLSARVVDVNASLRDAVIGGTFIAIMTIFPASLELGAATSGLWSFVGVILLIGTVVAIAGGAVIFILSAATDSGVRSVWPEKLHTLSLMRRFRWYNEPVGWAFVRGGALALALIAIIVAGLAVVPGSPILLAEGGTLFLGSHVASPLGFSIGRSGWSALMLTLLVLMGICVLMYQRLDRFWLAIIGTTVVFAVLQVGPIAWENPLISIVMAGCVGFALTLAFVRYDALTCFLGLFLLGVLWDTAPGWMVEGWFANIDALGALAIWMVVMGGGMVAVLSGRTGDEAGSYVPVYLKDIRQKERLQHEIELAQQVQQNLLPRRMPQVAGLNLAAVCLPAYEVGGDYYDFIKIAPDRLGIVIGDVSGKGIQAAFFMTLAKGFLQTLARDETSPKKVLCRLNRLFCDSAPRGTFISMIYGVVDLQDETFTFARAGHNPLVVRRDEGGVSDLLKPTGIAIGLTSDTVFDEHMEEHVVSLQLGDALVLYTDGFTEAVNTEGEQFGTERLIQYVASSNAQTAERLLQQVSNHVHRFISEAPRQDDMTMIVVQRKPKSMDAVVDAPQHHTASERISPTGNV